MTKLRLDAESTLAQAVHTSFMCNENDLFLVLRNQDGKVLWSGDIHQWSTTGQDMEIRTRPVTQRIEWAREAAGMRAELELRENGLL